MTSRSSAQISTPRTDNVSFLSTDWRGIVSFLVVHSPYDIKHLFARLLSLGIDLYAYATFTTAEKKGLAADMRSFVDRLQTIHPNLPLRLVPLRIEAFGVVQPRVRDVHERAMAIQEEAVLAWNEEIVERFSEIERQTPMPEVQMGG